IFLSSWHHILKGKFLQGKQNRRADHLICILVRNVELHYKTNYLWQEHGLKGPNLELQQRRNIQKQAQNITSQGIQV
ncbi:hypothetical protein BS47DRAFT_1293471, partial [Hydnum rufescens UP504]